MASIGKRDKKPKLTFHHKIRLVWGTKRTKSAFLKTYSSLSRDMVQQTNDIVMIRKEMFTIIVIRASICSFSHTVRGLYPLRNLKQILSCLNFVFTKKNVLHI